MPWWEPVLAYLLGSAVLLALSLVGAMWHRERYRRAAVSAVFEAAADLVAAAPGVEAEQARHRLALASAAARQAVAGYRLRPAAGPLHAAWSAARERPPPPPSAPSHRRSPGAALPPRRNRPRTVAAWRRGPPRPASSQPRTGRPRRGLPDQSRVFAAGVAALARQLGGSDPDETYRVAHDWRAELERGLAEPDPAHAAAAWLPVAIQLEHAVDAVAATDGDRAAVLALLADHPPVTTPAQAARLLADAVARLP